MIINTSPTAEAFTPKHNADEIEVIQDRLDYLITTTNWRIFWKWINGELKEEAILTAKLIDYHSTIIAEEAIKRYETRLDKTKPLHLDMGEGHPFSAHLMLQAMTILKINARGYKVAMGIESPTNLLNIFYQDVFNKSAEQAKQDLEPYKDKITPAEVVMSCDRPCAPVANRSLVFLMQENGISVNFNDAARTVGDNYLDLSDPLTRKFAEEVITSQKLRFDLSQKIYVTGKDGMHIRNLVGAYNSREHAKKTGAQIYISTWGGAHVAGAKNYAKYPYNESVYVSRKANGDNYISIVPLSREFKAEDIPDEARNSPNLYTPQLNLREFKDGYTATEVLMIGIKMEYLRVVNNGLITDNDYRKPIVASQKFKAKRERLFQAANNASVPLRANTM